MCAAVRAGRSRGERPPADTGSARRTGTRVGGVYLSYDQRLAVAGARAIIAVGPILARLPCCRPESDLVWLPSQVEMREAQAALGALAVLLEHAGHQPPWPKQ